MFGFARTLDMHVVSAHERLQSNGSSVFVAEHLRWNRGQTERAPVSRSRSFIPSAGQLSMFVRKSESVVEGASPGDDAPIAPIEAEQLGFL